MLIKEDRPSSNHKLIVKFRIFKNLLNKNSNKIIISFLAIGSITFIFLPFRTLSRIKFSFFGNQTDVQEILNKVIPASGIFEHAYNLGGMASETRALFVGAYQVSPYSQGYKNIMQFCTIQTTGNALDFGDMLVIRGQNDGSTSDCHGGLSE